MEILMVEPFYCGSHAEWIDGYARFSSHEIRKLTLPRGSWRWRMREGCSLLAQEFLKKDLKPDLIIASDLLDLPTFLALTREKTAHIPTLLYFHENQLTYPWSPREKNAETHRFHLGFTNYLSALSATKVWFNSNYHMESFLTALHTFLSRNPDQISLLGLEEIKKKSSVFPLGFDLNTYKSYRTSKKENSIPTICWNHRWDREKNPEQFFKTLFALKNDQIPFKLIVLGEQLDTELPIFTEARSLLSEEILHFGYANSREEYLSLLSQCDLLPVTSNQDFFGMSIVEAIATGVTPLLPNRLSYPELIPHHLHPHYLYNDEKNEFSTKLLSMLTQNFFDQDLDSHIEQFNWTTVAKRYDRELLNLLR